MIVFNGVTLQRGTKVLLNRVSVTINPGEKVALVGRNGAGKSSLFGLLNSTLHEDSGDLSVPSAWRLPALPGSSLPFSAIRRPAVPTA